MRFVSLFAGIGGLDLGLERAGMTCVGQVEWEAYPQAVLEKHWPDVPRIGDVRSFEGTEFGEFDLLVGGYPCQPFSVAGSRKGKDDIRHLWPEVHRIIRRVRPRYVLLENVTGHLSLGFGDVLGDLAACGYDAEWDCIPAAAVGAPHRRDRVFIVAYPSREPSDGGNHHTRERVESGQATELGDGGGAAHVADTHHNGFTTTEERRGTVQGSNTSKTEQVIASKPEGRRSKSRQMDDDAEETMADTNQQRREEQHTATLTSWARHNTRSTPKGDGQWAAEPDVGRVADGVPARVDRLKGLGNAVVPQVAEYIGHRILKDATETQ